MARVNDFVKEFINRMEEPTKEIEKLYDRLMNAKIDEVKYGKPAKDYEAILRELLDLLDYFNKRAKEEYKEVFGKELKCDIYPVWLDTLMNTRTYNEAFEDPFDPAFESPEDCLEKYKEFREFRRQVNERIREHIKGRKAIISNYASLTGKAFEKAIEVVIEELGEAFAD